MAYTNVINSCAEMGRVNYVQGPQGANEKMKRLAPSALFQVAESGKDVTEGSQAQILCHLWSTTQYVGAL